MDNETDCNLRSFPGKIICVSESEETDTTVEASLYLTTEQVKAKVMQTYSESDLRDFLEKLPQFYNYKSTIFTDLGEWKRLSNKGW